MAAVGDRFRSITSVPVTVWWELDTVAVLRDYDESCLAELPAGEYFEVVYVEETVLKSVRCKLDHESELLDVLIPRKRQNHILWFRSPTPYDIEIKLDDLERCCELIQSGEGKCLSCGYDLTRHETGVCLKCEAKVRVSAASSLSKFDPSIFIKYLKYNDAEGRKGFADLLGMIGPAAKDAIPALIKALKDEDKDVRKAAQSALKKIKAEK